MAEFVEIMKQARRLCEEQQNMDCCVRCPMQGKGGCMVVADVENIDYVEAERKIMDWAAEHPEPVYPSWYQYQETSFPGHTRWICPMMFGVECPSKSVTTAQVCTVCRNNPIPAEIAEKLGIEPKAMGGNENG